MNNTVSSERKHIGFFGMRNSGKSSLVNAFTGQQLSIVSDTLGTTTDPVRKTMELLPLGPVVIIDTPGIDDEGDLGRMRVNSALRILNTIDIAILVIDITKGIQPYDELLISKFKENKTNYIVAFNKSDIDTSAAADTPLLKADNSILVSAQNNHNIEQLKEMVAHIIKDTPNDKYIISDLIIPGDVVVLVVPIDSSAPKGRLILPQQMVIRELLEAGAISVVTREHELQITLDSLGKTPAMIVTDSQAFGFVSNIVPDNIPLTSFSILMMRYKGDLPTAVKGAEALDLIENGDKILICEGCTHHRQCEDIGTVKLPDWITGYTGKNIDFNFTSGHEFPTDSQSLSDYALVIHCGGCMLTEKEVHNRMDIASSVVPFTNYGVTIAKINGILDRSLEVFNG